MARDQEQIFNELIERNSERNKALFASISAGKSDKLGSYLKDVIDVSHLFEIKNSIGQSILHCAIAQENFAAVQLILKVISNSNDKTLLGKVYTEGDGQGNTPIFYAMRAPDKSLLLHMLANSNKNQDGESFLSIDELSQDWDHDDLKQLQEVIESGDLETIRRWGTMGRSFKIRFVNGDTPLHRAVLKNQWKIADYLVQHEPALFAWHDYAGKTGLDLAHQLSLEDSEKEKLYQQLLASERSLEQHPHQKLFDALTQENRTHVLIDYLSQLTDCTPLLEVKNEQGQGLLHVAIDTGNQEVVDWILKIVKSCQGKGFLELPDAQGNTALHYAVAIQNVSLIAHLVIAGANTLAKNHEGITAKESYQSYLPNVYWQLDDLPQKIQQGELSFVQRCLAQGISFRLRYQGGDTPLHIAVRENQLEIVRCIVGKFPELITYKNFTGQTPVQLARDVRKVQQQAKVCLEKDRDVVNLKESELSNMGDISPIDHDQAVKAAGHAEERSENIVQLLDSVTADTAPSKRDLTADSFIPGPLDDQKVKELSALLEKEVTVDDFRQLRSYLPTLWSLMQIYCHSALQMLESLVNEPDALSLKQQHAKLSLESLFGPAYNIPALKRQITAIAYWLQMVRDRDEISQSIVLHETAPDNRIVAWVNASQAWSSSVIIKQINIVPSKYQNITYLVRSLIHEASHIANASVDFAYRHSKRECSKEPEGSLFHQKFDGLLSFARTGTPEILQFNERSYRIFEIAIINKMLGGQCTQQELEQIVLQSNKIIQLIHNQSELIRENSRLINGNTERYRSLAMHYGLLDEANFDYMQSHKRAVESKGEGGGQFTKASVQITENYHEVIKNQEKRKEYLQMIAPLIGSELLLYNADSVAISTGVLAGIQKSPDSTPVEGTSHDILMSYVYSGIFAINGLSSSISASDTDPAGVDGDIINSPLEQQSPLGYPVIKKRL